MGYQKSIAKSIFTTGKSHSTWITETSEITVEKNIFTRIISSNPKPKFKIRTPEFRIGSSTGSHRRSTSSWSTARTATWRASSASTSAQARFIANGTAGSTKHTEMHRALFARYRDGEGLIWDSVRERERDEGEACKNGDPASVIRKHKRAGTLHSRVSDLQRSGLACSVSHLGMLPSLQACRPGDFQASE